MQVACNYFVRLLKLNNMVNDLLWFVVEIGRQLRKLCRFKASQCIILLSSVTALFTWKKSLNMYNVPMQLSSLCAFTASSLAHSLCKARSRLGLGMRTSTTHAQFPLWSNTLAKLCHCKGLFQFTKIMT